MCGCLSCDPYWGPGRQTTQASALTGNQTSDPLVHRLELNPLRHTSQGKLSLLLLKNAIIVGKLGPVRELHLNTLIICNQFTMCQESYASVKLFYQAVFFLLILTQYVLPSLQSLIVHYE